MYFGFGGCTAMIPCFLRKRVKTGNGTGVTTLSEFDPENDQTVMRVSASHIVYELDFRSRMLIWVMMRSSGAVPQRVPGTVIAAFPAVDIRSAGLY